MTVIDLASMRPPEFTGGNRRLRRFNPFTGETASMRPPEFTGGNTSMSRTSRSEPLRFNEAAGIHRRKLVIRLGRSAAETMLQ